MFDANQSLRISFENLVGTVQVDLQETQLYRKKENICRGDHHRGTYPIKYRFRVGQFHSFFDIYIQFTVPDKFIRCEYKLKRAF